MSTFWSEPSFTYFLYAGSEGSGKSAYLQTPEPLLLANATSIEILYTGHYIYICIRIPVVQKEIKISRILFKFWQINKILL